MLYVYGIVDCDRFETISSEGQEAGEVVSLSCGAFAAAVSVISACTIEATQQNVWRHERVLERLMRHYTVLPLRFGTICPDTDALREFLLLSADDFLENLGRVRGKVEIALRIVDDNISAPLPGEGPRVLTANHQFADTHSGPFNASNDDEPAGRGAAYLRARLQHHHNESAREAGGQRLAQMLRQQLDTLLDDVVCAAPADAATGYRVSCLVERVRVSEFSDALGQFRADYPRFAVTCTGPWPPYSFVTARPLAEELS